MIEKIISGGQTGADQGALDAAIRLGIDHGGWVPAGRRTEAGPLPDKYRLTEMPTGEYSRRTEKNVVSSEATVIFSHGALSGGSRLTRQLAEHHGRPWLHIDLTTETAFNAAQTLSDWIQRYDIRVLNVAGPRASQDPDIYQATADILESAYTLGLVRMPGRDVPSGLTRLPGTVAQAVEILASRLRLRDKNIIAHLQANQLRSLLWGLDPYLSDELGLGKGNDMLMAACTRYLDEELADETEPAMAVITELWKKLSATHRLRAVK